MGYTNSKFIGAVGVLALCLSHSAALAAQVAVSDAARVCESGVPTRTAPVPVEGCRAAHAAAIRAGQFEQAMRHAVTGCEKYQRDHVCTDVAHLSRLVANRDQPIEPVFAIEVERLAQRICLSGMRVSDAKGVDVSASVCGLYAHQFILAARYGEWENASGGALQRHFSLFYEPEFATLLYRGACVALKHEESCRRASALAAGMDPRLDVRRHAQADASMKELRRMVAVLDQKNAAATKKMKFAQSHEVAAQISY